MYPSKLFFFFPQEKLINYLINLEKGVECTLDLSEAAGDGVRKHSLFSPKPGPNFPALRFAAQQILFHGIISLSRMENRSRNKLQIEMSSTGKYPN